MRPSWGADKDGIRDGDRRGRTGERARARRGVSILGAGQRAAVDRAEAGVVLQDGVADQFLRRLVASEVVAGQDIAGTASEVIEIDVAEIIVQIAVARVGPQVQPAAEILLEHRGEGPALNVVVVEARLAEELLAVVFAVQGIAAAVGGAVPLEVVADHGQRGAGGRLPGDTAHQELFVITRMVVFELAVLELAREPEGQRRRVADRVPDVEARFAMLVGPALNVDFAKALGPGKLA